MGSSRKTKTGAAGKGAVFLMASLLIGSAIIRISAEASAAMSDDDFPNNLMFSNLSATLAEPANKPDRTEIRSLLEALQSREIAVVQAEKHLEVRAKALDVAQVEIERRLSALEKAEERLKSTLSLAQTAAEDDLAKLTTVYENMKPKDSAALFEAMEPEFAAGFLARMRPDVAAKIMSGIDPQAAYSISAILAGRNAKAPKS